MRKLNFKFFLVRLSPWPIILSFNSGLLLLSLIIAQSYFIKITFSLLIFSAIGWLYEIQLESSYEGSHTRKHDTILYLGFILFLLSEILIFATLFFAFFYNSIIPGIEIYNQYPYPGITKINPLGIPSLNTSLLYSSGITATISLVLVSLRDKSNTIKYLLYTIFLSFIFIAVQYYEYNNALFTLIDGIYATNFYVLTSFHGFHIIIGTLFLIYSLLRVLDNSVSFYHKLGLDSSSLYWHFVDFAWIFIFLALYQWGS